MNPLTEENDKMNSSPAPGQLYELREWLLDRIDGGEEMRGEDGLISDFIRQIDAQDAELADLKQRLLPQFQGRAQRAEHERDSVVEELIALRSTPSATGEPVDHGYDRTASLSAGHYVCTCGGACSPPDARGATEMSSKGILDDSPALKGNAPLREGGAPIAKESAA